MIDDRCVQHRGRAGDNAGVSPGDTFSFKRLPSGVQTMSGRIHAADPQDQETKIASLIVKWLTISILNSR